MARRRPVTIAITPWLRVVPTALGERTSLYTLDPAYAQRVAAAGARPVVVPPAVAPADAVADVDGLVLSGGSDVHPEAYGAEPTATEDDAALESDRWELALLAEARRLRLPTLGICRGMQLLAVAHGGSLVQHVDHEEHPGMGTLEPEETLRRRHAVALEPGTRLRGLFRTPSIRVNTIHHQAVAEPGTLRVAASGPGGVIEAVEATDWPALGVQWHPEKMDEEEQDVLFRQLVDDAVARRG